MNTKYSLCPFTTLVAEKECMENSSILFYDGHTVLIDFVQLCLMGQGVGGAMRLFTGGDDSLGVTRTVRQTYIYMQGFHYFSVTALAGI